MKRVISGSESSGLRIYVNARFHSAPQTGVQRYATEITRRLSNRLVPLVPTGAASGWRGHAWEQLILPRRLPAEALLWSPANSGPLSVARQVVTIHDMAPIDHPEWFTTAYATWQRYLLPRLARRAIRIITVSQFTSGRIQALAKLPAETITVIPEAAGEHFRPVSAEEINRVRHKYQVTGPFLLAFGAQDPRKNLETLVRAWQAVRQGGIQVSMIVIGLSSRALKSKPGCRAQPGLRYLGGIDELDLPGLFSAALGLVYPSFYEGFGLPILEAMACGTPVIAANAAAIPETAGTAAWLVNPRSAEEIGRAISSLAQNEWLREKMRAEGLAHAARFSWDRAAQQTWETLQQAWREGSRTL